MSGGTAWLIFPSGVLIAALAVAVQSLAAVRWPSRQDAAGATHPAKPGRAPVERHRCGLLGDGLVAVDVKLAGLVGGRDGIASRQRRYYHHGHRISHRRYCRRRDNSTIQECAKRGLLWPGNSVSGISDRIH